MSLGCNDLGLMDAPMAGQLRAARHAPCLRLWGRVPEAAVGARAMHVALQQIADQKAARA
jgi:hypothetical protein